MLCPLCEGKNFFIRTLAVSRRHGRDKFLQVLLDNWSVVQIVPENQFASSSAFVLLLRCTEYRSDVYSTDLSHPHYTLLLGPFLFSAYPGPPLPSLFPHVLGVQPSSRYDVSLRLLSHVRSRKCRDMIPAL